MNSNNHNKPAPVVKHYRAIPTAHPAYKAFENKIMEQAERDFRSVEEWLDADDDHTTPHTMTEQERCDWLDLAFLAMAAMAVICGVTLIAVNLGRLVF